MKKLIYTLSITGLMVYIWGEKTQKIQSVRKKLELASE